MARRATTGWARPAGGALIALALVFALALTRRRFTRRGVTRTTLARRDAPPRPDGTGIEVVVNPSAGPALGRDPADQLREALPGAKVVALDDAGALPDALEHAAAGCDVVGICGGDGSVNAAAGVASHHDRVLFVVPGGTLNHFARDLGTTSVDDAVAALRDGCVAEVDLGEIGGRPFLNTASFGAYPDLVDVRERLEGSIGKWPAMVVALARVLARATPCPVEIDGEERLVWMSFIGNCRYHPSGFAPRRRERLDDGRFDVRIVDAKHPYSRARLVLAVLSGRLGRCRVYEERIVESLRIRSLDGPLRLASDGETFTGPDVVEVRKAPRRLAVIAPAAQ